MYNTIFFLYYLYWFYCILSLNGNKRTDNLHLSSQNNRNLQNWVNIIFNMIIIKII